MKLLYIIWDNYQQTEIQNAFNDLGHTTVLFSTKPRNPRIDPKIKREIISIIKEQHIHFLFSTDYFPIIADVCHSLELPYISWCYNSPSPYLYSNTILYPENHICIFDSFIYQDIKKLGASHVYYVPLAFSSQKIHTTFPKKTKNTSLSFIGSLCTSSDVFQNNLAKLSEKCTGFIFGLIQAQKNIYGDYFLRQTLSPILEELQNQIPLPLLPNGLDSYEQVFADFYLTKLVTRNERMELLTHIFNGFKNEKPLFYIANADKINPNTIPFDIYPIPEKDTDFFSNTTININLTKRSVFSGVPQQIYNIFGSGGFVLSNFQNDLSLVFQEVEIPFFTDLEDLNYKIDYFLSHSKERAELTHAIQNEINECHTVFHRIQTILRIIFDT